MGPSFFLRGTRTGLVPYLREAAGQKVTLSYRMPHSLYSSLRMASQGMPICPSSTTNASSNASDRNVWEKARKKLLLMQVTSQPIPSSSRLPPICPLGQVSGPTISAAPGPVRDARNS